MEILEEEGVEDWQDVRTGWFRYLDEPEQHQRWRFSFLPIIIALALAQGREYNTEYGFNVDLRSLYTNDWAMRYTMRFVDTVRQTTGDTLEKLLLQAREEGWSIPEIRGHLQQVFQQWMNGTLTPEEFEWFSERMPDYRAEMIARTESIYIGNMAAISLYNEAGLGYCQWWATEDDRTCGWCMELHGTVMVLGRPWFYEGENFNVEDEQGITHTLQLDYGNVYFPPLHCRCRCVLLGYDPDLGIV